VEQGERARLKEAARRDLEERIQQVQRHALEQTGLKTRRRDIIAVLRSQANEYLMLIDMGVVQSRFSSEVLAERIAIVEELIVELAAVEEA
jgi:hypothetical protein